jgi:hypothetical protein
MIATSVGEKAQLSKTEHSNRKLRYAREMRHKPKRN